MEGTFVVGDVHGQLSKLVGVLQQSKLIGADLAWTGGSSSLWFMGDYFDRGPDGIGVVDLIMRLQREAAAAGGHVGALLGNHDPLILSAYYFGERPAGGPAGDFRGDWLANGGVQSDLDRLRPEHMEWLTALPAMARLGGRLLAHADAAFYLRYGKSVDEVNQVIGALLRSRDEGAWDRLLGEFSERLAFANGDGAAKAERFLQTYGAGQLIHGHTPISYMTGESPEAVSGAYSYAGGLCVNVDAGLYRGGGGFVLRLPD